MRRDPFLDRHPLLYHAKNHCRGIAGLALGAILCLWIAILLWAISRRLTTG